jgi:hypothetical protein
MKIQNVRYYTKSKFAGLSAEIVFTSGKTHQVFYEVEKQFADLLAHDASPFLAAMLPIGMLTKEDLEIVDSSISKKFLSHMEKIMEITKGWNHGFHPISIKTKTILSDRKKGKHVGSFFSGGADSYYTYIKNQNKIDRLIFVHGFDIKIHDTKLYNLVEKNITQVAKHQNIKLVKVKTNLREMYDQYIDWDLGHGFAIGSVALFLRSGFTSLFVSCGLPAKYQDHHSLTPDLDPLWSAEYMSMIHYGCHADKLLKLKTLARFPIAMQTLRVCWVNKNNAYNCSSCEKCMRNMLGLYACNSLEKCLTFKHTLDLDQLKKVWVRAYELKYYQAILDALDRKGDTSQVRQAVHECIVRNSKPRTKKHIGAYVRTQLQLLDKKYNKNRVYWFLTNRGLL